MAYYSTYSLGISGYSGWSGISGATGAGGASGISGYSGINGTIGSNGASGISGYSGLNGIIGSNGASGLNGTSGFSGVSGASAGASTINIVQSGHSFVVGDVVGLSGSVYVGAKADTSFNAEVVGIVTVANTNDFNIVTNGRVSGFTGLTAGTVYFLSPVSGAKLQNTEPTTIGQVSKPLLVADSTTTGYFNNIRGFVLGQTVLTYSYQNSDIVGTTTYVGELSLTSTDWNIYKMDTVAFTSTKASGTSNYATNWTNRYSLSYT